MVLHIQATFRPILNVWMADDGNFIAPIEDALKIFEYSIPHLLNTPLIEYSNVLNTEVVHGLGSLPKIIKI